MSTEVKLHISTPSCCHSFLVCFEEVQCIQTQFKSKSWSGVKQDPPPATGVDFLKGLHLAQQGRGVSYLQTVGLHLNKCV